MSIRPGRGVLVTGASGVAGTALVPYLARVPVYALADVSSTPPSTRPVPRDVCAPRLGLDPPTYAWLAARVDAIVHCAANTDFAVGRSASADVNVVGTREVLRFANDAGALVYHVSTCRASLA